MTFEKTIVETLSVAAAAEVQANQGGPGSETWRKFSSGLYSVVVNTFAGQLTVSDWNRLCQAADVEMIDMILSED